MGKQCLVPHRLPFALTRLFWQVWKGYVSRSQFPLGSVELVGILWFRIQVPVDGGLVLHQLGLVPLSTVPFCREVKDRTGQIIKVLRSLYKVKIKA